MFYEAMLTVVILFKEPELPISVIDIPQPTLNVCLKSSKDIQVKVAKDLNKAGVKYQTNCTKIGSNV